MNNYQQYSNSNVIRDHAKLLSMSLDEVKELYDKWLEIRAANEEIYRANSQACSAAYGEITHIFDLYGIDYTTKKGDIAVWFEKNIYTKLRLHFKSTYHSKPSFPQLNGDADLVKIYTKLKQEAERKSIIEEKSNRLLRKSIEYAINHAINIDDLTDSEIINYIKNEAGQQWMQQNYPNNTQVEISYAICGCETYFIGERRCSCGNRRISAYPEGNILDGFYLEVEPY